jgi:molybdopterin-guanine dinucleotide biosynthesis protein
VRIVMVGGHTRNIGKTSVIEGIIKAMPEPGWTAVKITQFGHGMCSINGESCGCETGEHQFSMTTERGRKPGTDTARFLAAGAKRSLWLRTRQGELFTALSSLRSAIELDEFVIVESNSLRRFIKPAVYLQVVDPGHADFKMSAQQFFDVADAYVLVDEQFNGHLAEGTLSVLLARELKKKKPCFTVSPRDGFVNSTLIRFVRSALIDPCVADARAS